MRLELIGRRRAVTAAVAPLLLVAALGMAGCGGGASQLDEPEGQDAALVPGDFVALPKPDGATPIADPTVDGRTTTQSFKVEGLGVQEILGFYQVELADLGWGPQQDPEEVGDGDWQGVWARGTESLEVSVSPFNSDDPVVTQLDLVLTD